MLGQKPSKKSRQLRKVSLFFLAAVGGGRSHCIAVERVGGFPVNLAFALQGLAHFIFVFLFFFLFYSECPSQDDTSIHTRMKVLRVGLLRTLVGHESTPPGGQCCAGSRNESTSSN